MRIRVAWRHSLTLTGTVLKWLAVPLCFPLVLAVYYGEPVAPFLATIVVTLALGLSFEQLESDGRLGPREAFLMVALTWLLVALVGAIPFVVAGHGTISHPVNAAFEAMSGLTTTGATVLRSFDEHAQSIMMWRQLIQWLGGLGILVLVTAVFSQLSVAGAQLMETETQYDNVNRLTPHIEDTARLILKLYTGLTAAAIGVLYSLYLLGLAPNMTLYNAVAHAFTSVATAGFSPEPLSIEAFEPIVHWALMPFMILGSTSFVLMYFVLQGNFDRLRNSEEFWFYVGSIVFFAGLVMTILTLEGNPTGDGFGDTVRQSAFNVVSIITTTGYANADFNAWSPFAKHLLFMCMFLGGMAGSTTCSIKSLRWLVVFKAFRRDLFTSFRPEAIRPVRLSGQPVDEETIRDVYSYTLVAVLGVFLVTLLIVVDGARTGLYDVGDGSFGEFEALGAAASTFLNIGPAFGPAGPYGTYDVFSTTTKAAMVVVMWVGRIEIIPVLVLLTPSFWRS
ncbi:TrkH family potassium uptake protein [Natronobacterium gregoryi]|uniref:Trk-type K+ transport system, membrane component n=2 Tax=Natronobacterium gregoryi TaxID=44930 RepID=L0ADE5_NATGS|nr:TrkH family potassium uptake protein [Natronobacterium gregoryi]AFZ71454.1 Trk-type K+ transport system, membrane component [Natronobacterium gregoryi SP2]ELY66756.1 Trk-type transport system (substrate potassium) 1, subunit 2.1 [Natronobacterium gregoryi SP2]PLK19952.1 TrkH family potassium uptake protein [Natronobacterium gregoryi SP2]SFJ36167.1 trk system potassium uptake protein TrkH [Natronobacterium gregoryi]